MKWFAPGDVVEVIAGSAQGKRAKVVERAPDLAMGRAYRVDFGGDEQPKVIPADFLALASEMVS